MKLLFLLLLSVAATTAQHVYGLAGYPAYYPDDPTKPLFGKSHFQICLRTSCPCTPCPFNFIAVGCNADGTMQCVHCNDRSLVKNDLGYRLGGCGQLRNFGAIAETYKKNVVNRDQKEGIQSAPDMFWVGQQVPSPHGDDLIFQMNLASPGNKYKPRRTPIFLDLAKALDWVKGRNDRIYVLKTPAAAPIKVVPPPDSSNKKSPDTEVQLTEEDRVIDERLRQIMNINSEARKKAAEKAKEAEEDSSDSSSSEQKSSSSEEIEPDQTGIPISSIIDSSFSFGNYNKTRSSMEWMSIAVIVACGAVLIVGTVLRCALNKRAARRVIPTTTGAQDELISTAYKRLVERKEKEVVDV